MNKRTFTKMEAFSSITFAAEEAKKFIDDMVDMSTLKNMARVVTHTGESTNIRFIGWGTGRFLKPAATFTSADYKKQFSNELITLTTDHIRGCVVVYDKDLEDGIEGAAFTRHLMSMVQMQMANELEEYYWLAEKTVAMSGFANDDIRSLRDGWRYQIDNSQSGGLYYNDVTGAANILDASNTVTAKKFSFLDTTAYYIAEQSASAPYGIEFKAPKMINAIPNKYMKFLNQYRYFMNPKTLLNHNEYVSKRATSLGDMGIQGNLGDTIMKVPVVTAPNMPLTMEVYSAGQHENCDATNGTLTDVLLTPPNNLIVNFQRKIKIEPERSAADEATYFYYSLRTGMAVENVAMCVLLKRVVTF